MPSFDYISATDFRESIVSDYDEMNRCAASGAWKSAQVLAGSIVESLLIDYLTSTPNPTRTQKYPLRLDLGEAITICKTERVLSDRTADLCSVVRSYRNLIHPGRMVRLGEDPPSKTTSDIAVALIDLIVADISRTRRATFGFTAEQIISKIVRDANCISIFGHLLEEVSEEQRKRLLVSLIPEAYLERDANPFDDVVRRLEGAHRITFDAASVDVRRQVSELFVKMLKEADGDRITKYRNGFFRAPDLQYLTASAQALVKEHLLSAPAPTHTMDTLKVLAGLGAYLNEADASKWFDPLMQTLLSAATPDFVKKKTRETFAETVFGTEKAFDTKLLVRINDWVVHFEKLEVPQSHTLALELQEELKSIGAP